LGVIAAVLPITTPVFLAGAGLLALAARKIPVEQRRRLWLKYLVYVLVVHLVLATIVADWFVVVAASILAAGAVEFVRALVRIKGEMLRCAIGLAYLGLAGLVLAGASRLPQNLLVFLYLVVAGFDGFSEIFGRLLGKTKLAPALSPGKTMEGAIAGGAGAVLLAAAARPIAGLSLGLCGMAGAAIAVTCLSGDLAASWVKRRAGIKDYSRIIPGHGGVLDRFDSFLGAGAVAGAIVLALGR